MRTHKGQMTALVIWYVIYYLAILAVLAPIEWYFISNITSNPSSDPITNLMLPLSIPFQALGILYMIIIYSSPRRAEY